MATFELCTMNYLTAETTTNKNIRNAYHKIDIADILYIYNNVYTKV